MQLHRLKFTEKEVEQFAVYYNAGHSIKEVGEHFKISYRDALHYLIYYGHYKPKKRLSKTKNMCTNPRFFKHIDTSDKAYFLGLLMSDGYIMQSLYSKEIGIALKAGDKYVLDKLNNYVSPEKAVSRYKNSFKWKVISPEMYNDLIKYGIVENKSHSEYEYPKIPKRFDKDFIRGYFDGDGCITIKSSGYNVISFCSNSIRFLQSLALKLGEYGIHTRPIYENKRIGYNSLYTLYLSGGINKSIFKRFLYNDAETFLYRKYEKFKEIPC